MRLIVGVLSIALLLIAPKNLIAHEGEDHGSPKGSIKAEEFFADAVEVGNKICPVSGEEVGAMGKVVKVEYKGKIYNLCCTMCRKDFLKDPEKYSKIAEEEVAAYEEEAEEGEEIEEHDDHSH